jgi:hypothetical protein
MMFKEQAEQCRKQANEFAGRPEAPFLLRVASAFDELAIDPDSVTHPTRRRDSTRAVASTF